MENQNEKDVLQEAQQENNAAQESIDQKQFVSVDDGAGKKVRAIRGFRGSRAKLEAEEALKQQEFADGLKEEANMAADMTVSVNPFKERKGVPHHEVTIPSDTPFRRTDNLSRMTKGVLDESENKRTWAESLSASTLMLNSENFLSGALTGQTATFSNRPTYRGIDLNYKSAVPKFTSGTRRVGGSDAATLMNHFVGNGTTHNVILWHSGFRVRIRAPRDIDIITLNERINNTRLSLGRQIGDIAFSSTVSLIVQEYFEFFCQHVVGTNLQNNVAWQDLISHTDIQLIAAAMGLAMFPDGFNYSRATMTTNMSGMISPKEESMMCNVQDMLWVNEDMLTERQLEIISHAGNNLSREQVLNYQADFIDVDTQEVQINDNIKVSLRMPSLQDFIDSSKNWFADLDNIVREGFKIEGEDHEQKRWLALNRQQAATYLRRFSHYIDQITLVDGDSVMIVDEDEVSTDDAGVNNRRSIEQLVNILSGKEDLVEKLVKGIVKFQNTRTVAVVGYCVDELLPGEQAVEGSQHLVAIDAVSLFFTLVLHKSIYLQKNMQ